MVPTCFAINSYKDTGLKKRCLKRLCILVCCSIPIADLTAQQDCVTYKLVPQVTYESTPLTVTQYVDETVMETQTQTTYKPVWTRETRQRTTTVLKPTTKTSERVERFLVRRPVVETNYVEKEIEETSYQTFTELKKQRWLVEKPMIKTEYREQQCVVKKPVTRTYMQTENVTTLKPTTIRETQYVPTTQITGVSDSGRNRLRWLRAGAYVDPMTGLTHNKRAGLHWVPEQQVCTSSVLVEQQIDRTTYTPETVQVQRPIQITEYVDQIETQKIPVQVSETSRQVITTTTPITVTKPVIRTVTQKVPVQEVQYKEEIVTRRVPVTETTYQKVTQVEPYEVEVCKWVAETREVQVPRTVRKRVDYSLNQTVAKNNWITVPVDAFGNIVMIPETSQTVRKYPISERLLSAPITEPPLARLSNRTTIQSLSDSEYEHWLRQNNLVRETQETSARKTESESSVLVPETTDDIDVDNPSTKMIELRRPPAPDDSEDGGDSDEPDLNDPGVPSVDDNENESRLDIESSESSDIESREGT